MQNVWLPAFRCTSKPGNRSSSSLFNAFSAQPSRDPQILRPLWSSIAPISWRPRPACPPRRHDTNTPPNHALTSTTPTRLQHLPQRQLHNTRQLEKRTKGRPARTAQSQPSQTPNNRIRIPFSALSPIQLTQIFTRPIDYNTGNEILRILHARRITGALVDRGIEMDDAGSDAQPLQEPHLLSALEWLRKHYPVNEQAAAERWAESESAKVSQGYIDRAESLGLFKKGTGAEYAAQSAELDASADEGAYITTVTERSALEELKQYHKKKAKEEKEQRIISGEEQKVQELRLAKQEQKQQVLTARDERIAKRREERQRKGMVSKDEEVPELNTTSRLLAPTVFSVLLVFGMYTWAQAYKPPIWDFRMFREVPNSVATVGVLIGINLCVWSFWRMPPLWRLLNKYTVVSPAIPVSASIFGNIFSHMSFTHLVGNMLGLWLWGIPVHEELGRGTFLALYISGGTLGALASLWSHVLAARFHTSSQGASGAVYAISVVWAWFYWDKPNLPTEENVWPFIADIARWAAFVSSILPHFLPAFWMKADGVAHIGGAVTGGVGSLVVRAKRKEEMRAREAEERLRVGTVGEGEE